MNDTDLLETVVWLANANGLRYTPLHHRQYANVYRLSTAHRKNVLQDIANVLRLHGIGATDPLKKLDGAYYIEVF